MNFDFSELLRLFDAYRVKYLIIGGYAVIRYSEPRYTKDLDLWIDADPENATLVYAALKEFGAPLSGLTEKDFAEEGYFYRNKARKPTSRSEVYPLVGGDKHNC